MFSIIGMVSASAGVYHHAQDDTLLWQNSINACLVNE